MPTTDPDQPTLPADHIAGAGKLMPAAGDEVRRLFDEAEQRASAWSDDLHSRGLVEDAMRASQTSATIAYLGEQYSAARLQPTEADALSVERVFAEEIVLQSWRLNVAPTGVDSPGRWRDRVRKAALLAALNQPLKKGD